ncbi:MAG: sulfite exporter TauE/SafE family protein [Pseudomonadota bacterium]|nr:sulfite exporter TauE/SafE family protein [Pseudomonadota bacterium]
MNIYLPIAEMSVNIFALLGLGVVTGVLSGLFGVGGGFLMTPLLIFIGVPPAISVSTVANQIVASSVSGFLAHWRRDNVDFKMGAYLLAGGLIGSFLGVELFRWLKASGQIDLIISVIYVVFLGVIGALMAGESIRSILKVSRKHPHDEKPPLAMRLPLKVEFPKSKLRISAIMPVAIGFFAGVMVSLMGIGGGFFLIPAMIYVLGMPTNVVIGTSLFQIIFITANVTFLQAVTTQTVDIVLALLLLTGSVVGAQVGTKAGSKLPPEYLRALLAALVLGIATKLAFDLFTPPADVYSVSVME